MIRIYDVGYLLDILRYHRGNNKGLMASMNTNSTIVMEHTRKIDVMDGIFTNAMGYIIMNPDSPDCYKAVTELDDDTTIFLINNIDNVIEELEMVHFIITML